MPKFGRWKWVLLALAFCLVHLVIYMFLFYHGSSDVHLYYEYAAKMGDGLVPYRDFSVEYPPVALGIFYLPYLLTHDVGGYCTAFAVEMMLFSMLGIWLVLGLVRQLHGSAWLALGCYTIAVAVGTIAAQRFDMAPAVITLAALYAFCRGKYKVAWVVLAIGVMTKLYPAVLAPLFLIYQWRHGGWRRLWPSLVVFVLILVLIAGPALKLAGGEFVSSFTIQSNRSLQVESLYASLLLLMNSLGLVSATTVQGPMSFDISSPMAKPLENYSFIIMGLALVAIYVLFIRRNKRDYSLPPQSVLNVENAAGVINYSVAAVAAFIVTNKVFSPQFMLWLCPLAPLFYGRWHKMGLAVFLLTACLTWYVYPMYYFELADGWQVVINALVLRNILLILMVVLLVVNPSYPDTSSVEVPVLVPNAG
jgi:uncharacterized membrane protein